MDPKLIFVQLNEINFEIVDKYIQSTEKNKFKNLKYLKTHFKKFETYAEEEYENLEPWIQWVSVYLGKDYKNHKIFRLGDIVSYNDTKQFFELIEEKGFKVGAISPMNSKNNLKNPAYFIPDPWTNTTPDKSGFSKRIFSMLKQSVNDNSSGRLSFSSIITIFEIIFKTFNFKNSTLLFRLIFSSLFKPWKKSLVLDYLIHNVHLYLLKNKVTDFSSVFLNAGAHIQHHYFFNSKHVKDFSKNPKWYIAPHFDPIEDMLTIYDKIIGDYINLSKTTPILIATGLRQTPYDNLLFHYRLKNHESFLNKIGIKFSRIFPRMTRDFEITFDKNEDLIKSKQIMENIICKKNNIKIFNEIETRNKSLFVTLTYPLEIEKNDKLFVNKNLTFNFLNEVYFVAIKNGKHDKKGYAFCSPNINFKTPTDLIHVSKINNLIMSNFN